jgi:pre-mRNA-splicing factor CWC26
LSRYEIRDKYDKELRSKIYWADPMGHQLNQESDANEPRVKCPFPSPPNRFNILAGYRWDGVIRGNGFESRFLQVTY